MHCTDGSNATFHFKRVSIFRGYGVRSFSRGTMRFAYGFTAEEAQAYLTLPAGKKLRYDGAELKLVDQ